MKLNLLFVVFFAGILSFGQGTFAGSLTNERYDSYANEKNVGQCRRIQRQNPHRYAYVSSICEALSERLNLLFRLRSLLHQTTYSDDPELIRVLAAFSENDQTMYALEWK